MINQIISHQKSNLFLNFANIKGCRSGTCGVLQRNLRRVHTLLMASCSERNLIGWRTESDRTADGIWSGGGRNLIGQRTETGGDVPPTDAPTKQTERVSHRTRGTHRTFWQRKPPTDRHRCALIRRVWQDAIPTPPITQPNHLWKSVKSVGEYYHAGAAASAAPTKQMGRVSHRTRRTHRTFWQRKPPTDRHGYAQIRSN